MAVNLKFTDLTLKAKLADLATLRQIVMPKIATEFQRLTPVKTGNAKANTQLKNNQVEADYPYAGVLDAGRSFRDGQMRGSDQAPRGMSEPTKEYAKRIIPGIVKQLGNKR